MAVSPIHMEPGVGYTLVKKEEYKELQKELDRVKQTLSVVTNERDFYYDRWYAYYDRWYEADDARFFWKAVAIIGWALVVVISLLVMFVPGFNKVKDEEPVNYTIKLDDSELRY